VPDILRNLTGLLPSSGPLAQLSLLAPPGDDFGGVKA
jgi:hypothetical protein